VVGGSVCVIRGYETRNVGPKVSKQEYGRAKPVGDSEVFA